MRCPVLNRTCWKVKSESATNGPVAMRSKSHTSFRPDQSLPVRSQPACAFWRAAVVLIERISSSCVVKANSIWINQIKLNAKLRCFKLAYDQRTGLQYGDS